jgi:hypothetical protein
VARAVGPVVGEDRAVAELVLLEVEAVGGRAVVPDGEVEEVAGFVSAGQRDAESAAVSGEPGGPAALGHGFDGEAGEVERDLAQVLPPDREDDLGLGLYLVARVGDAQADAVLERVEPGLTRVVVARVRGDAQEQRECA